MRGNLPSCLLNVLCKFLALPYQKRRAVHAVYALCRYLDDIADGDSRPVVQESEVLNKLVDERDGLLQSIHQTAMNNAPEEHRYRLMALVDAKERLNRLFAGDESATQNEAIFIAINEVFKQFPVRLTDFETIIEGMEDDLFEVRHKTWDEVRAYCYKVASAVGLVLIEIYGCEDAGARIHAIDMGIQLQLINILRDVSEDYRSGRIYLPINALSEYNIEISELGNTEFGTNHRWKSFVQEYIEIVRRHQESAQHLFEYLDSNLDCSHNSCAKHTTPSSTKLFDDRVTCSASALPYPSGERFVLLQNFRSAVYVLDGRNRLTVEAMH